MHSRAIALDSRGLPPGYPMRDDWEIAPRQVDRLQTAGEPLVLVDCRTPAEHDLVRLPGSMLVPLQQASERLPELERLTDKKVIVYCHHGVRSLHMTSLLRRIGITDAWSMAGGIDLWACDIAPEMPRY